MNCARPARRIVAAKRQFNLLAGWTPDEDTLPDRFLDTPLPDDPAARSQAARAYDVAPSPRVPSSALELGERQRR